MPAPPQIRPSKDKDTAVLVYKFSRRIRIPRSSASRSIGESLWNSSGAFRFSTLRSTTNPAAMLPGLFFDAWSSIRCFATL